MCACQRARSGPAAPPAARFVACESCLGCHETEYRAWQDSHHDLAMQTASEATVLGDFDEASITYFKTTSRFFKRNGRFFVNTEGPGGTLADFEIRYTFGVEPLQQYLIEMPSGRLQCLTIAWDTEGKRWFHLYPDEKIEASDPLHWTGIYQNWNMMCADCHSTGLRKNYDARTDSYRTTWAEIDVGCQACHGPGSRHLAWAEAEPRPADPLKGLTVDFPEYGDWRLDPAKLKYRRVPPLSSDTELDVCAPCHSRRSRIRPTPAPGAPFLDGYLPSLLEDPLYYSDGQIRGEVYVYGSFLQSKMYHRGVRCRDCHEPHSLELRYPEDNVCIGCHLTNVYDDPKHHFHKPGSSGSRCLECHMPARRYMQLDARRDHSIRIPRPDLSLELDAPNACSGCHDDKPVEWAAEAAARWWGGRRRPQRHSGEALAAGRRGLPGAAPALIALARDEESPGIVRATALSLLAGYGEAGFEAARRASREDDPLLRIAAARLLGRAATEKRAELLALLLDDPLRGVRIEAARSLVDAQSARWSRSRRRSFERAWNEFEQVQRLAADTPSGPFNLALVDERRGRITSAETLYRRALQLDPGFLPARFNLANLLNRQRRNGQAERILRGGLRWAPEQGELHYSLGLVLAEQARWPEAVEALGMAVGKMPGHARVRFNYALALDRLGRRDDALAQLGVAARRDPRDPRIREAIRVLSSR